MGKTNKYDGKNKQIWWEKLTGSCHVCKLQPLAWCYAGSVSLRTFEKLNWTEYRGLAWITNQHVQRISFVQSSHFMTLGLDTLGWGSQLLSASFPPRQPRYIRQFRIRRNEGGKFDARRDWRISWVKSALSSPWDLGSRSFLVSTTPFSSSSGPPLLRRSKEGMRPSALEFYWRGSTLVSNQETEGRKITIGKRLKVTAAYHWNGSCIALPLTAPETILGEIPEIAHFKTRFAAWRLEGDCCLLLLGGTTVIVGGCQRVAEAKKGGWPRSPGVVMSTQIKEFKF